MKRLLLKTMYTLYYGKKRVHFLAMPRTASKSCGAALTKLGAVKHGGHHSVDVYHTTVEPGDLVLTTVRNHWDWFVSFWHLNGCPDKFENYVPALIKNSEWIQRNPDCTRCELFWKYVPLSSIVLRYESIEQDFTNVLVSNGFPKPTLERVGKPKPKPYQSYYRPETIQLVHRLFSDEITKYRYEF